MIDRPDTDGLHAKVFPDPVTPGAWCVTNMNKDGGYEAFAIFAGRNARGNAIDYARQLFGEFERLPSSLKSQARRSAPSSQRCLADRARTMQSRMRSSGEIGGRAKARA
jgi:hypothetical protein